MAAPIGNQNAVKAKRWQKALERALARAAGDVDKGLDAIADNVVREAIAGDHAATREVAERMDGKAAQAVTVLGDEENPLRIETIRRVLVDPKCES